MTTGLCFTAADEALLAGGWPRQVRLVDGHPHDKNPVKSATAWLASYQAKYHSDWPREVAYRALRAGPRIKIAGATAAHVKLNRNDVARLEAPGRMSVAETRAALVELVASFRAHTVDLKVRDWVYIAETILGADATLDAIAEGFDEVAKKPVSRWVPEHECVAKAVASILGFVLLRAPKKNIKKHTERLAEHHARFSTAAVKERRWQHTVGYFDMSLNGAAGVMRYARGRKSTWWAEYAHDDPDYVRDCVAADSTAPMSVRLVSIAGVEVMKNLTKRRFYADELPSVMRDFGMVRAPEAVELALSLIGKSTTKDAPIQWLKAHVEYARPFVERAAKSGEHKAKVALRLMAPDRDHVA